MNSVSNKLDDIGPNIRDVTDKDLPNMIAGLIIAAAAILGSSYGIYALFSTAAQKSFAMEFYAKYGMSWSTFALSNVLALTVFAFGVFLAVRIVALLKTTTHIGDKGLCISESGKQKVLLWDQVSKVTEIHIVPKKTGRGIAATAIAAMDYVVVTYEISRSDDEIFQVDKNLIEDIKKNLAADVPWLVEQQ